MGIKSAWVVRCALLVGLCGFLGNPSVATESGSSSGACVSVFRALLMGSRFQLGKRGGSQPGPSASVTDKLAYLERIAGSENLHLDRLAQLDEKLQPKKERELEKILIKVDFNRPRTEASLRETLVKIYRVMNDVPKVSWFGWGLTEKTLDQLIQQRVEQAFAQERAIEVLKKHNLLKGPTAMERFKKAYQGFVEWSVAGSALASLVQLKPAALLPEGRFIYPTHLNDRLSVKVDHYWKQLQNLYISANLVIYLASMSPHLMQEFQQPSQMKVLTEISQQLADLNNLEVQEKVFIETYRSQNQGKGPSVAELQEFREFWLSINPPPVRKATLRAGPGKGSERGPGNTESSIPWGELKGATVAP